MGDKGYLILENGMVFEGFSFGRKKEIKGEIVFNTGMTGYPESFTDPSYFGQILTLTYPLIGNYGVPDKASISGISNNFESDNIHIRGLIVSSYYENSSHWQSKMSLSAWLNKESIPALQGIDTRSLTCIIRKTGVMKALITFKKPRKKAGFIFEDINKENLVSYVSQERILKYSDGYLKLLIIDCGLKYNQIRLFEKLTVGLTRVPWDYDFHKENTQYDAVFISNGPGDPQKALTTIKNVEKCIYKKIPVLGICLGHQILGLALGAKTYKMKYGRRGQNQPVKNMEDGKCYITSQNHGFSIDKNTLPKNIFSWFENLNDGTNEGIKHKTLPFFGVQFHPESSPGPTDTEWIFGYFIEMVKKWKKEKN